MSTISSNVTLVQAYFEPCLNTSIEADWKAGSTYRYYDQEGNISSEGEILEIEPERHLKTSWKPRWISSAPSIVSWDLQPLNTSTLLKLTHSGIDDTNFEEAQMHVGWIYVISSLKSLLETGAPLPSIFG